MCLGSDAEAIVTLSDHLATVVNGIYDRSWRHFRVGWHKNGCTSPAPPFSWDHFPLRTLNHLAVGKFFRSDVHTSTPLMAQVFGDDYIGEIGSGVDELLPVRLPGRPRL